MSGELPAEDIDPLVRCRVWLRIGDGCRGGEEAVRR